MPTARLDAAWSSIQGLVQVRRYTDIFDTRRGVWQACSETAYYVCARELSAHNANHPVRSHLAVENALHHVRDVALAEDASRARKVPGVFAQLRMCVLNAPCQVSYYNIRAARRILG